MVAKAFARWGFCYEKEEKLKRAKEDFLQVRGLNPTDVEATNALRRIEQALKHVEMEQKSAKQMSASSLLDKLNSLKESGNNHFKQNNFSSAI